MTKIGVVTDSTSVLAPELVYEYGIRIVPTGFVYDGKEYRDFVDITTKEFWKMFPEITTQPTTSASKPGDFYNVFKELSESTDSILCVTLSKKLSATFDAANQAAELLRSEDSDITIEVIDSENCQGALGFIALEAARAAKADKSMNEVVKVAEDLIPRVKYFMLLDASDYLIQLGRAPKELVQNKQASVKPILGMVSRKGVVENLDKADTIQAALPKMADMVGKYIDTNKPVHIMLHYPDRTHECEQLRDLVTSKYKCAEVYMSEYTPTMIVAAGPMFGLSFYS